MKEKHRQTISLRDRWKLSQLMEEHVRTFPDREGFCEYVDPRMDDKQMAVKATQEIGCLVNVIHVRNMRQAMFGKLRAANTQEKPAPINKAGLAWIEKIEHRIADLNNRMARIELEWFGSGTGGMKPGDPIKSLNDLISLSKGN